MSSTLPRLRRVLAVTAALSLAIVGLTVVPAATASAFSSSSHRGQFLTFVNNLRVGHAQPKWAKQDLQDKFAQAVAQAMADCNGCSTPASPPFMLGSGDAYQRFQVSAGSAGGRLHKAEGKVVADDADAFTAGSSAFGAVGYVTKGSKTYFTIVQFQYTPATVPFSSMASGKWSISGPKAGSTSKPKLPALSPTPTSLSYAWSVIRGGAADPVSTDPTYKPEGSDVGNKLYLTVTAHHAGRDNFTYFLGGSKIKTGDFNPQTLKMVGLRYVDQTLDAFANFPASANSFHYTWYRNGHVNPDGVGNTYQLKQADLGKRVDVKVVVSGPGYHTVTLKTHTSKLVKPQRLPNATSSPTLSPQAATVGATLTADPGSWPIVGATFSYQWMNGGDKLSGGKHKTYKVPTSLYQKQIYVLVTAHLSGFTPTSEESTLTFPIQKGHFATVSPTITGGHTVGSTLTAHIGTWIPTATSYTYQWYLGSMPIDGATHKTYKTISDDATHQIYVRVTGKKHLYVDGTPTSLGYMISS